jgi:hypothetical protein
MRCLENFLKVNIYMMLIQFTVGLDKEMFLSRIIEYALRYSAFTRYWRKNWEYNGTVLELFIDIEKAYKPIRREVLYNILFEFYMHSYLRN